MRQVILFLLLLMGMLTVEARRFGNGLKEPVSKSESMKSKNFREITAEKDPERQEKLYKAWLKRYYPKVYEEDFSIGYVYMLIGENYAKSGNSKKALEFAGMSSSQECRLNGAVRIGEALVQYGDFENAAKVCKMATDYYERFAEEQDKSNLIIGRYRANLSLYAEICNKIGHYADGLEALQKIPVNKRNGKLYAFFLDKLGRPLEALLYLGELMRSGLGDKEIAEMMKPLYVKLNKSDKGFDAYLAELDRKNIERLRERLSGEMISKPAPDFTLVDQEGKTVTLGELRGKVVVLDFWATWCVPCRESFPAMQRAVDKFRNDPNVEFLFIHTWEREKNASELAAQFLKDNGYTFRLLMDMRDLQTGENKVVKNYGVTSIPTKIVIDPQGLIRFKVGGAVPLEDEIVNEITLMIEMARKASSFYKREALHNSGHVNAYIYENLIDSLK